MKYEDAVRTGADALREETMRTKSDYTTRTGGDHEHPEAVVRVVLDAIGYRQMQEHIEELELQVKARGLSREAVLQDYEHALVERDAALKRIGELEVSCDKWCEATIKGLAEQRDAARALADQLAAALRAPEYTGKWKPALDAYKARDWT